MGQISSAYSLSEMNARQEIAADRTESLAQLEIVDELARSFFGRSEAEHNRWDFEWLLGQLSQLYNAEGVTLFIEEDGILLPAASADQAFQHHAPVRELPRTETHDCRDLHSPRVFYRPGEGLTGWVFEHGKALRIEDNEQVIRERLGLERAGPRYVDHDHEGAIIGQFLAAPLRMGLKVVGVLRLSRRTRTGPFSQADESSLQHLADLLGSALGNWRRSQLAEAILESINEGIAVSRRFPNADGTATDRIVFANPGIASILGRNREEVESMSAFDAYAEGEYAKLLPGLRLAKEQAIWEGRGEYGPVESKLRRLDGSVIPVMISFRIQSNQLLMPPTYSTIAIARDTSERERLAAQHEELLDFLDELDVAYFRSDRSGMTTQSNYADARISGFTPADWKKYPRTRLYDKPQERDSLLDLARSSGDKLRNQLIRLRRKNRDPFWADVDLRISRDASGQEVEVEGFYRDVSDQMKLQRYLNEDEESLISQSELLKKLKEATELQIDYVSSIGHQIQAPLGSLLGTLQALKSGAMSTHQFHKSVPAIESQLRTCSRLVRNLSFMDTILRGRVLRAAQVRFARLVLEVKNEFTLAAKARDLRFQVDESALHSNLEIVFGQQELLRQVIVNLIDNAIKYSSPHSIIHIRSRMDKNRPVLEVASRSLSIRRRDRKKLFSRGFRAPQAKASIPHGTGLGLWLVREILKLHQAVIQHREEIEDGQRWNSFEITFPVSALTPHPRS